MRARAHRSAQMSSLGRIATLVNTLTAQPAHELPRDRARTLARLAMEYAYAGLPMEGLTAVKEALALANEHNLAFERAEALASAAMCHHMRVDHMMSIACGFDAYQGFADLNEYGRMGHQLITLAAACRDLQAHDLAEAALNGCLTIAARINDKMLEARTHNVLGLTFRDCQRFEEAEREFVLSRDCLIVLGEWLHVPKVTANIGVLFRERADVAAAAGDRDLSQRLLKRAIEHMREGLQAALSDDNNFEIADKTGSIGQYYFSLGDLHTARVLITQSLEMGRELKHARLLSDGYLWLGQVELSAQQYLLAEQHLRAAIDRARQAGLKSIQQAAHQQLSACYAAMERADDASAQAALSADLHASFVQANLEAQRELRMMWQQHLSQHPMMKTKPDAD
jgi:tetratricopeptide (TPR) repeat protein